MVLVTANTADLLYMLRRTYGNKKRGAMHVSLIIDLVIDWRIALFLFSQACSYSAANSSRKLRMAMCCGQMRSHLPHLRHSDAFAWFME